MCFQIMLYDSHKSNIYTLQIPIKALPPGVKPMPLPVNARRKFKYIKKKTNL